MICAQKADGMGSSWMVSKQNFVGGEQVGSITSLMQMKALSSSRRGAMFRA